MEISTAKHDDDIMVITLSGQLEVFEMPALSDQLNDFVEEGLVKFVVDLSCVNFMGSASLTTLIRLLRRVQKYSGTVKLVEPENSTVRRILYITKFDHVFSIFKTVAEAIASF